jgi:hypothetical protein
VRREGDHCADSATVVGRIAVKVRKAVMPTFDDMIRA